MKDETSGNTNVTNADNSTLEPRNDDANFTEDSEIEFNITAQNPVTDKTAATTNSPDGARGSPKEEDNSEVVPVATNEPNLNKEGIEGKEKAEVPVNEISQEVLGNESNTEVKVTEPEQEEPVHLESSKFAPEPEQASESVKPNQEETAESSSVSASDQVQPPSGDVLNTDINTGSDTPGCEELSKSKPLETEATETTSTSLKTDSGGGEAGSIRITSSY